MRAAARAKRSRVMMVMIVTPRVKGRWILLKGRSPLVVDGRYGGGYSPKIGECVIVIQSDIIMMNHQTRMLNNR